MLAWNTWSTFEPSLNSILYPSSFREFYLTVISVYWALNLLSQLDWFLAQLCLPLKEEHHLFYPEHHLLSELFAELLDCHRLSQSLNSDWQLNLLISFETITYTLVILSESDSIYFIIFGGGNIVSNWGSRHLTD